MGLALYRKYRPATFAEVVGQEHVTGPLSLAVDSGRINHAYLFSGPRGCGKTSSARILARSLNCEQGPTSTPCGVCQSCRDLAPDGPGNIDVIEIDAASHGGVDDARELRERAFQLPVASRYKIYIVDEAHMVTNQGFNALLKVVEEPPESVVFVFATTEADKVLPTIRSRTHHYPFRLVPPATMRTLLVKNCADEGIAVEASVIPLVVRAGGGSVRDSQSLLDQLIAGSGEAGLTYADALALLGVTDEALLDDIVEAIGVGDGATVFGTVERVVDAGHDPRRFAADLLDRLRDLILLRAVPDAADKGLLDVADDQLERMSDQASRLDLATLSRLADLVHVGLTEMRGTTAPRLGLELICARLLVPEAGTGAGALAQRLDRLERRMQITEPVDAPASSPRARAEAELGRRSPSGSGEPAQRPEVPATAADPTGTSPPAAATRETPRAATPAKEPAAATKTPEAADVPSVTPSGGPTVAAASKRAPAEAVATSEPTGPPAVLEDATRTVEPKPASSDAAAWPEVAVPGGRPTSAHESAESSSGSPAVLEDSTPKLDPKAGHAAPWPEVAVPGGPSVPPATPEAQPVPVSAVVPGAGDFDAAAVRRIWPDVVEAAKRRSKVVGGMAGSVSAVSIEGNVLTVAAPPGLDRRLSNPTQRAPLEAALGDVLGVAWTITTTTLQESAAELEPDPRDEDTGPPGERVTHQDPEAAALDLLRAELGASPLES